MAYLLKGWLQCNSESESELLCEFLKRESRPKFEEDVSLDNLAIYKAIEEIDFPEEVEVHGDLLWVCWTDYVDFEFKDLQCLMTKLSLRAILTFEVPDNPMSGDSEEEEADGRFWVFQNGTYVRTNTEYVLGNYPESLTCRFASEFGSE